MLSVRPSLQGKTLDLGALDLLPEGTLGHEFARYFRDNKISPFETTLEIKSDIDFISKRYRETHDLLHVLTGYATDVMGEMELQAYALGNLGIRTAMLILLVGTLGQLKDRQSGVESSGVRAADMGCVPPWPRVPAVPRFLVRAPLGDARGHPERAAVRARGASDAVHELRIFRAEADSSHILRVTSFLARFDVAMTSVPLAGNTLDIRPDIV